MKIGKTYTFEAAHRLPGHNGKCADPHGHSYVLEVEMAGGLICEEGASDDHMVVDYAWLDALVEPIIERLDHCDLNEDESFKRTTAEGLVLSTAGELLQATFDCQDELVRNRVFGDTPRLTRVRLYETAKAYAEWAG